MKIKPNRSKKLHEKEVLSRIKSALKNEKVVISIHADQRMSERNISWFEVKQVLLMGYNERSKDKYVEKFKTWTYAIRYDIKVSDKEIRRLRIPVAIDEDGTIIVSAIDLDFDDSY